MSVMKTWLCSLLILTSLAQGAFLGEDFPENKEQSDQPEVAPVPRPIPPGDLSGLIRGLTIGPLVHHGNVTIYPLQLDRGINSGIRTLSEAINQGWLEIRELGQARVPVLDVRNTSDHSVFLMSGEIVLGGKQDRVIQQDVLVPPHSAWVQIPVYCVEQDRWDHPVKPTFRSGYLAGGSLRRLAAASASQDAVWENVASEIERSKAKAPTRSYRAVFEDAAFKKECDVAVARYRKCLTRQTVGAVVIAGGRVIHCDVFSDPALCARLWPHITRSYWIDGSRLPGRDLPATERMVRRFLDGIRQSDLLHQPTSGSGQAFQIRGALQGNALFSNQQLVHASLFNNQRHPNPRPEILR